MTVRFIPGSTETARFYRQGGLDAYGLAPERAEASDGATTPCRHCLKQVPKGAPYLILAHRPFGGLNPYTETGPIFICAEDCLAASGEFPKEFLNSEHYLIRGYSKYERTIYGTGAVVRTGDIEECCDGLLHQGSIEFIHIRSASNNCFQCRVVRA